MANGRNQGLHVAVISLVILTIISWVIAVVMWKSRSDQLAEYEASKKAAQTADTAAHQATENLRQLKKLIRTDYENAEFAQLATLGPGDTLTGGLIADDLRVLDDDTGTQHYPDYSHALQALYDRIDSLSTQLNSEQDDAVDMEKQNILRAQVTEAEINVHKQAQEKAEQDLADREQTFQAKVSDLQQQTNNYLAMADETAREKAQLQLDAQNKEAEQSETIKQQRVLIERINERLKNFEESSFEQPDGQVVYVSNRLGSVWIDLGSADHLPKQQTFSVYSSSEMNVAKKHKKADIEVTGILRPHLAEARITNYNAAGSEPILEHDVIYTPVWSPGRKMEFALAGFMDIDGDGESDRETVEDVIRNGGGVIVAELLDSGEIETHGDGININTKYLIMGDRPEVSDVQVQAGTPVTKLLQGMSTMIDQARDAGVEIISVADFLEQMGYQPHRRLVKPGAITPPTRRPAGTPYEREARRRGSETSSRRFVGSPSGTGVGGY